MNKKNDCLLVDEIFAPVMTEESAKQLKEIQKRFIESYIKNKEKMDVEEWLSMELKANFPEKSDAEIQGISSEIIKTLERNEEKKCSLEKAIQSGRNKEAWFAAEIKRATEHMNVQDSAKYLQTLDEAVSLANEKLYSTITTQQGIVSKNLNLDGFIAEQYHAQTFNMNAEAAGSLYRARVLEPGPGERFAKNSVDIVIMDNRGKIIRKYQSKYCKDVKNTLDAFQKGDYRGQRKLVPDGQENTIQKATNVLESPDGIKSNVLSKRSAKELQKEAQSGKWNELDWNEYKIKKVSMGIGKEVGQAAVLGAAMGGGLYLAEKVWNDEPIDGEEVLKVALESGVDIGVKAAAASAIKVGAERGLISLIPKGTPAGTIANIAFVAVENVKVAGKIASGELTVKEGLEKMEEITVSTVAGIAAGAEGAALGAAIGSVVGPVGTVVGGFVGGTIGYMVGSEVGKAVVKATQKVRDCAVSAVKSVVSSAASYVSSACRTVASFFS